MCFPLDQSAGLGSGPRTAPSFFKITGHEGGLQATLGKAVFTKVNFRCANSFAKRGEEKKCSKTFGHRQDCSNQGKWNDIARNKKFPSGQKRCIYVSSEISITSQIMFENGTACFRSDRSDGTSSWGGHLFPKSFHLRKTFHLCFNRNFREIMA